MFTVPNAKLLPNIFRNRKKFVAPIESLSVPIGGCHGIDLNAAKKTAL